MPTGPRQRHVVEIGSGIGNLTYLLSLAGASVTGLEIDRRFGAPAR